MIHTYSDFCSAAYAGKNETLEYMKKYTTDKITLTFIVTEECNFRCTYCYEKKNNRSMKIDDAKKLLEKVVFYEDNLVWWNGFFPRRISYVEFMFFGGESLLEIKKIDEICSYFVKLCKKKNTEQSKEFINSMYIRLATNGSLIRTPDVKKFIHKWKNHLQFDCTIDGVKEFHDACRVFKDTGKPTFDIVYKNIKYLQRYYKNIHIETKGTTTPQSVDKLFESFKFLTDLFPKNSITISAAIGVDWDDESLKKYKAELIKISNYILEHPEYNRFTLFSEYQLGKINKSEYPAVSLLKREATCYTLPAGIVLSADGRLYHCQQFSELNNDIADRVGHRMHIGDINSGVTDEGLEFLEYLKHYGYSDSIFKPGCAGCSTKIICKNSLGCMAFLEKYRLEGTEKDFQRNSCNTSRVETAVILRHYYLMEKKKWEHNENQ